MTCAGRGRIKRWYQACGFSWELSETETARKKVPARLGEAVARVLGADRPPVAWLKRSLRTRGQREANITAEPVLMEFDAVLA